MYDSYVSKSDHPRTYFIMSVARTDCTVSTSPY
jgi:hypothetical protein